MRIKAILIILFIYVLHFQHIVAQNAQIRFDHFSSEEGLSDYFTECIVEDSYGYIWVGAKNGLNRFDGFNFKTYTNNPKDEYSLPGYYIHAIIEDDEQRLWIGSHYGGLSLYNRELDHFERIKIHDTIDWSSIIVRNIKQLSSNKFILATQLGLCLYDHDTNKNRWFHKDPIKALTYLSEDTRGIYIQDSTTIWYGRVSYGGLGKLSLHTNGKHSITEIATYNNENINDIIEINDSIIWLGTRNIGLYEFNINSFTSSIVNFKDIEISELTSTVYHISRHGSDIYIGYENGGLIIFDTLTQKAIHHLPSRSPNSISSNSISHTYSDRQGNTWITTHGGGINIINKKKNAFKNFSSTSSSNSLSNNMVSCLYETEDNAFWIGTDGGGLNYFDRKNNSFKHYTKKDGFESNAILHINPVDKHNLYISSWEGGVALFNTQTKNINQYHELVQNDFDILNENVKWSSIIDNELYITTHFDGIYRLDLQSKTIQTHRSTTDHRFKFYSHGNTTIRDSYGDIWNATTQGLFWINDTEMIPFLFDANDTTNISDSYVSMIYEDSKKRLWACTGKGLDLFNRKDTTFVHYGKVLGINEKINSIIEDDNGNLWLGSNKGLILINPITRTKKVYRTEDGLPSNQFTERSTLKTKSGEIAMGTISGFTIFHPDSIPESSFVPPVYISNFKIFNIQQDYRKDSTILTKDVSATDTITLNYDQNYISFEYVAIDLSAPNNINFAYKLEGFDKDWVYVNRKREAIYTNIDPGNYIFKVKATNADNIWVENERQITIIITPPFWQTTWFRILVVASFVSLVVLAFYLRTRNIQIQNRLLEVKIRIRTRELEESKAKLMESKEELTINNEKLHESVRTKDRFFSIIAHDLKNPMNSLLGFSDLLIKNWDNSEESKKKKFIEIINTSSNRLYSLLTNLLDWSRAQTGKIEVRHEILHVYESIQDALIILEGQASKKQISLIRANDFDESLTAYADKNLLDTVIRNITSNAIKYTPNEGEVVITAYALENDVACIRISDNGVGMTTEQINSLFKVDQNHSTTGTNNEHGTGLGLLICHDFTEMMNGKLSVESEADKGTTFTITLPIKPND